MKNQEKLKQQEEENCAKQKQEHLDRLKDCLKNFLTINQKLQAIIEGQVITLEDALQKIAATIGVSLRLEQVVTLALLLLSKTHTTLMQLATGAGKSLMLGILAQYLNLATGKKVIVVVPTSFLHAYQ